MLNSFQKFYIVLLGSTVVTSAQTGLNELSQFKAECRASLQEPWRTIPWETSLIEAQNNAAREKKPIFIWAMDGHPLACT